MALSPLLKANSDQLESRKEKNAKLTGNHITRWDNMQNSIPRHLLAAGLFFVVSLPTYAATTTHAALRDELLQMRARDVEVRQAAERGDF